ncbi:hypothetical protein DSLASN_12340 [Desulfoluna limicola]|uniref:Glycosyl transferase n=1 Tax=Desulfoluna limicola TaxID=2810562 RepID=A0ABN6F2R9_9BACT|nr:MraY family glycosyltransferase [Desulfoluna limicola]BCS95602.1 hypothetical protein DSLASN_12340 [Desulfoluna limicola]
MTTILGLALIGFFISLSITPLVRIFAFHRGYLDYPDKRKSHEKAIPRIGGVAIFLGCFLAFAPFMVHHTQAADLIFSDPRIPCLAAGALVVFFLGLADDIYGIRAWKKLAVQILAAGVACAGGLRITSMGLPGVFELELGLLSLPVSIFWILIVINGINLIDGLDGLAAGITLFVCVVLFVLALLGDRLMPAMVLAALSGSVLGFLMYNYNPATIFMGDSGSYFLGYMLATLSVMGSMKSQAAATLSIPMIAMGIPLIDTVFATIRRFFVGQALFQPDKNHFHHRLVKIGYTQRRAVLILYGITIVAGLASFGMVAFHDERSFIILLMLGAGLAVSLKRLGYFRGLTGQGLVGWASRLMDEFPIRKERRQFIGHQLSVTAARDLETFWQATVDAAEELGLDSLHIKLFDSTSSSCLFNQRWCTEGKGPFMQDDVWPGLLAGFTIDGKNEITTELLFERDEAVDIYSTTYRRIGLLKDAIAHRVSQFSIEDLESARGTVLAFRPSKAGLNSNLGIRVSLEESG